MLDKEDRFDLCEGGFNEKKTILIVDDAEMNRAALSAAFEEEYDILDADSGQQALRIMEEAQDTVAALLLDMVMPELDGFGVLREMNRNGMIDHIPVFLITADDSQEVIRTGYELGVADIIGKPITPYFIRRRIGNVIKLNNIVQDQERLLRQQSGEIRELNRSLMETLATAIEFRDCDSGSHVRRMGKLTQVLLSAVARYYPEYGIDEDDLPVIMDAAMLHDIGKIAIPDSILNKPGRLTEEEFSIMKTHSLRGCELLESVPKLKENEVYKFAYDICRHHHERWDANGYPDGLKGDEISIWAQAVALADVYDALVNDRVYKKAYPHDVAVRMILDGECGEFNPKLMVCLRAAEHEIASLYRPQR